MIDTNSSPIKPMRFITLIPKNICDFSSSALQNDYLECCNSDSYLTLSLTDDEMPRLVFNNVLHQTTHSSLGAYTLYANLTQLSLENINKVMPNILTRYYYYLKQRLNKQKKLTDSDLLLLTNNEPITSDVEDILNTDCEYVNTRLFTSHAYVDWILPRLSYFNQVVDVNHQSFLNKINVSLLLNNAEYTIKVFISQKGWQKLLQNDVILNIFSYIIYNKAMEQEHLSPSEQVLLHEISHHLNQIMTFAKLKQSLISDKMNKYPICQEDIKKLIVQHQKGI